MPYHPQSLNYKSNVLHIYKLNGYTIALSPTESVYDKSNGIPHRIPPPEEQDSEGSELGDVDMLHDIDREKDVFRTKVGYSQCCTGVTRYRPREGRLPDQGGL